MCLLKYIVLYFSIEIFQDVDRTSDPPRTTFATVRIKSDGEFELPDEPVFTQAFYLATYTKDHRIYLDEPISLRQGYNEQVQFTLDQGILILSLRSLFSDLSK